MTPDQIQRFVNACDDLLSMEIDVPRGKPVTDPAQAENNLRQICGEIGENKNVFAAH